MSTDSRPVAPAPEPAEAEPLSWAAGADAQPLVSVIMIFLDAERFIGEALESVFAQTWPNWELLLVDDGSTDRSTAIARGLAAGHPERVFYLEHPGHANRGTGPSRNLGLRAARGRYITFLDADDIWLPERLATHVEVLEAEHAVGLVVGPDLIWHSWRRADMADTVNRPHSPANRVLPPPGFLATTIGPRRGAVPGVCSLTVRSEVLERIGGIDAAFVDQYEDQVLLAKLLLATPCYLVERCLAYYRQHEDSLVHRALARGAFFVDRPHAARFAYLDWLRRHLAERRLNHAPLEEAITAELRARDHPGRARYEALALDLSLAALDFARRCLGAVLPAAAFARIEGAWASWKQRRHEAALTRALPAPMNDKGKR